ncbi:hypothetical protein TL16_g08540 [Triparma laevis f. inornata]|uniref:Uncharacterized protein n=1 Tax=Triparma laevis f. inornata TaxID=1714386 RepID=A0A9W7B4N5_9STRA|nr:hypothetical protein TL16_g08540 [Triparma laevis f. inornata]
MPFLLLKPYTGLTRSLPHSVQSAGMGASSLQSFAAEMQQKALVQGVVSKLTQIGTNIVSVAHLLAGSSS